MSVVIETTLGDMTVDLFVEERPNTCLNFLKLCKIKYYNFCLFHTVQHNFIAQTGDPTGSGKNGESVYSKLYGEKAKYYEAEAMPKLKHDRSGLVSMVNCGNNMLGSQFFFTLNGDLQSLDGQHCVFGEVVEGHDTLLRLNETICDLDNRPYQDIRIKHTVILVDPYEDPPGLPVPDASPLPSAETLANGRIGPDEQIDDTKGLSATAVEEIVREREAKAQATILEIVGDIPDADIAPPENVLFVCKLNPVTSDDDLEIIFSRFGRVKSCEVIRDKKTGDSLQYAFVEFEDRKACEEAYFKMDNVLIDDRRIHVDFSQSVSKYRWKGKGRGVEHLEGKDEPHNHKYAERRRHTPDSHHKRDDAAQHDNGTGSPQVRGGEIPQSNPRDSPDPYAEEHGRKDESRERDRRERSRNAERDKFRSDHRTHSSDRDHRRRMDDLDRSRRGSEKRRESSRERERQRRSDDTDRDRQRRDRKKDSDHERTRGDRNRDSDHERNRSDRTRDSDRERSRGDRTRDSDRERSRSDRMRDFEFDRSKNSRPTEDSDKSRGDKKAEAKNKEIKKENEEKNTTEKERTEQKGAGNNVDRPLEKDNVNKDISGGKLSQCESDKTDHNPSQDRKLEEKNVNVKPSEETDKKNASDKHKISEKQVKDIGEVKQDSESQDKELSKGNSKLKKEEKQKKKPQHSDGEETLPSVHNETERRKKLEGENSRWQKKYEGDRHKRSISDHETERHGSRVDRRRVKKPVSDSEDKSDAEDRASDIDKIGSEHYQHDKIANVNQSSRVDDKERHRANETSRKKSKNGSDMENSRIVVDGEVAVPLSKKKQRDLAVEEKMRWRRKRRLELSPHLLKKRWRKLSSSSSDSDDSSSSDSSSDSSDSSSDSAKNGKAKGKRSSRKHVPPMKKLKKLKMVKKKKRKKQRHRKHSESDSSSESSDSSDYKRKYIKLKKKKKRKNISSDDSSSEGEARKRRERRKKGKVKRKPSTSEDSEEDSASVSSDTSFHRLLKKHKKRIAAEKRARKSRREVKPSKKKNYISRKRQHPEPDEQSSTDESESKIVKKDSKKNNSVEGKKVRKEVTADASS